MDNWTPQAIKAWTAGIIDGEGYVQIQKNNKTKHYRRDYYTLRVRVGNTDIKMLDLLQLAWGGHVRIHKRNRDNIDNINRRDMFDWDIQCTKARKVLEYILPYSVTKRKQVELAIDFQNRVSNRKGLGYEKGSRGVLLSMNEWQIRDKMYNKMRRLNKVGLFKESIKSGRTIEKVVDIFKNGK